MTKYLLIKDYMTDGVSNRDVERKLFSTKDALLKYMQDNVNSLFNAGFHSAEIHLYRVEEQEQ